MTLLDNTPPLQHSNTPAGEVCLREFQIGDSRRLFEIESRPEMARYQNYEPRTPESARAYIERSIAAQSASPPGILELAVCLQETGQMIGRVGASYRGPEAWLWYSIEPEHQGKGYASQAARAIIERLREEGRVGSLVIECDPRNVPSWRLAERFGFRLVEHLTGGLMIKGENCGSKLYRLELSKG